MENNIKATFRLRSVIMYSTYSLFFLMLFVPFEYQFIKAALIISIILSVTTQAVISGYVQINIRVFLWCLILICNGVFFVFWGTLNGYTDAIRVLPVYVIWPIVYIFIIVASTRIKAINDLYKLFTITALIISLYSIVVLLSKLNLIPAYAVLSLVKGAELSIGSEFLQYSMPAITSLMYLVPFIFSSALLWNNDDGMPIKPVWLFVTLLLSVIAMVFTSRRTFWILLLLAPILTFTFMFCLKKTYRNVRKKIFYKNIKRLCIFILCVIASMTFFFITEITEVIGSYVTSDVFVAAVTFKDDGTILRDEQLRNLLDGWSVVPLLGAGHGASLPNYLRSFETPWAYELSYPALLFQTGLVGFMIYFLEVLWIFYMCLKLSRENEKISLYIIPALVGMTCFLVANATNPYLQAFDHLWAIFVQIIFINVFLLNPRIENHKVLKHSKWI